MNIVVSQGAREFLEVTIRETTGQTISPTSIEIGLRLGSAPTVWHAAEVTGTGAQLVARWLVTDAVAPGQYTVWARVTTADEVSVMQVGDTGTYVRVS